MEVYGVQPGDRVIVSAASEDRATQETFLVTAGALQGPAGEQYLPVTLGEVAPTTDGWVLDAVDAPTGATNPNVQWSGRLPTCMG